MSYLISPIRVVAIAIFFIFLISCSDEYYKSTDLTEEFAFTKGIEGPAVNLHGTLFAVNFQKEGTIGKVTEDGATSLFTSLPEGSIGNGIRFDTNGHMFIADYAGHKIYRIAKGEKKPVVWAQDATMNQPNDLAISPQNKIYLSDPNWGDSTGKLWMVGSDKNLVLLEDGMGTTNGIEVSPDGKHLYVNESVQRNVWQYDILADGTVSNKTKLIGFKDFGLDGMRCDVLGNLYITRYDKGTVVVVSPEGKLLNEIRLKGKKPSNITFGGTSGKTCYVTLADRGCLETFKVPYEGAYFNRIHIK